VTGERILVVNGPNLNLLGVREPEVYGDTTLQDLEAKLARRATSLDVVVDFVQDNSEGALVTAVQDARHECDGLIVNPGALTHYSYSLLDALQAVALPSIEVHISNLYRREEFRHTSVTAPASIGLISGLGIFGYELALEALAHHIRHG